MHVPVLITLPQNKNEQLYKTGSARGDAWLGRISANNLLTLVNTSGLLKTLLPRCPIVFDLPWKILVLIYSTHPSAKPFITSFRPRLSHKKMYSLLPRVWAKRTREKKRYTLAEPCCYSLSRSRLFRNCHVALLLCLFAMELMVFFVCFDWFCF